MISILEFEKQLKGASLTKGKNYFDAGAVIEVEEVGKGVWAAEVEGTATYGVNVCLKKDNTVKDCFCDCRHNDEFCKHVIAVLYWLRNKSTITIEEKPKSKPLNISQLLKKISAEELTVFVKDYTSKNKDFKLAFEIAFAGKNENYDIVKTYDDLITKIIRKHTQKGFVHHQNAKPLAKELDRILHEIKVLATEGNLTDAFLINTKLLNQAIFIIAEADDSGGYLGGVIYECIELIEHIFNKCPIDLKEKIFDFIAKELKQKIYFDYGDYGYQLFNIFFDASILLSKTAEFLNFVDTKISKLTGNYHSYLKNKLQKSKIDFLKQIGNHKDAEELTLQNLDIVEIRAQEVEKLIANKAYTNAKKLINDGIKIAEKKDHPGTVSNWQKELLRIAVLEKDIETVRKLAKLFTFDRGFNIQFYKQWKNTFKAEEWTGIIEDHIKKTIIETEKNAKNRPHRFGHINYHLNSLNTIYITEGYIDRLWLVVKKAFTLDVLMDYHKHIFPIYADELLELYLRALDKEAEIASDRSRYQSLAYNMKKIAKSNSIYKEAILKKAAFFRMLYIKRPAFIDELTAIK